MSTTKLDKFASIVREMVEHQIVEKVCEEFFVLNTALATPYNSVILGGKPFKIINSKMLIVPILPDDFSYLDAYLANELEDVPVVFFDVRTPRDKFLMPLSKYTREKFNNTTEFTKSDRVIIE